MEDAFQATPSSKAVHFITIHQIHKWISPECGQDNTIPQYDCSYQVLNGSQNNYISFRQFRVSIYLGEA